MWQSTELRFASDHPTAAGHFPSNPMIPGALLLDEILAILMGPALSGKRIVIRSAKFFRPVRPGDSVNLRWQPVGHSATRFECWLIRDNVIAASGTIDLVAAPR
jgi:3-hydroxyacyl-[acyl-carrier-protein] dehydratase